MNEKIQIFVEGYIDRMYQLGLIDTVLGTDMVEIHTVENMMVELLEAWSGKDD